MRFQLIQLTGMDEGETVLPIVIGRVVGLGQNLWLKLLLTRLDISTHR